MTSDDPNAVDPVYWPRDQIEAAAIQQALNDEGIWSHLEGEQQSSWVGGGAFGNIGRWRMRLMVRASDIDRTTRIIESQSWPTAG